MPRPSHSSWFYHPAKCWVRGTGELRLC
jgi:hypothetical protein